MPTPRPPPAPTPPQLPGTPSFELPPCWGKTAGILNRFSNPLHEIRSQQVTPGAKWLRYPRPMTSRLRSVALVGWVGLAAGCADPNDGLSRHFPSTAPRALGGDGFAASAEGFAPRSGAETDPVRAAEASLSARGGLRLVLPSHGDGEVRFQSGDATFAVRESGASGAGRLVGAAVAFSGPART